MSLRIEITDSLAQVNATAWDTLVGDGCAFFEYGFLHSLALAGCVGPGTGWAPRYVICRRGTTLVGALPLFLKTDSYGEFIFDFAWAEAAQRAGMPYYPKLVVAAPFSPVGGARFLLAPGEGDELRDALLAATRRFAKRSGASGVHWLYVTGEEADYLASRGLAIRHTHQFQWTNEGYTDFDAFLSRFRSKRRNQIRRERRVVADAGVKLSILEGANITDPEMDHAWHFYSSTVEKYYWGRRYLNRAFFDLLHAQWRERLFIVKAEHNKQVVGGALNVRKGDILYGRYWGTHADIRNLHFEVCSYTGIEAAIERGIQRFEAGAGGGGHKFGRGFLPTRTYSAHEIYLPRLDTAVRRFLADERAGEAEVLNANQGRVLKF